MTVLFWIWLVAAVVFLIVELTTPAFLFACFAAAAGIVAVFSIFSDSVLWQCAVFAGAGLILVPLTRPLARRITKESPQKSNVDAMVGGIAIVTRTLDPDNDPGLVRFEGQIWQAIATEKIDEGAKVRIDRVKGARLYVSRVE